MSVYLRGSPSNRQTLRQECERLGLAVPATVGLDWDLTVESPLYHQIKPLSTFPLGSGAWIDEMLRLQASFGTPDLTPPALLPGDWTLANAETGGGLTLTILQVAGNPTSVEAQYFHSSAGWSGWIALDMALPGSKTFQGFTDFETYQVRLRLVNIYGPGRVSDTKSAAPTPPTAVPAAFAPGDWTWMTAPVSGALTLTLLRVPTPYPALQKVEYQLDGGAWTDSGLLAPGERNFTGLTNGQSHTMNIRGVNAAGNGAPSVPKLATPAIPITQPPDAFAPGGWSVENATAPAGDAVLVSIGEMPAQGGSPITQVQYKVGSGAWTPLGLNTVGSITLTGFPTGVPISMMLHAVNTAGPSPDSDVKAATPTPPSALPIALTPAQWTWAPDPAQGGTLDLTILAVPATYPAIQRVEYQLDGGSWVTTGLTGPGAIKITGRTNGVAVACNVRLVNSMGNGPASTAKNATPQVPAGTPPNAFTAGMWTFANAAHAAGDSVKVTIASMPGQGGSAITQVQYKTTGAWIPLGLNGVGNIDLTGFPTGVAVSMMLRAVNGGGAGPDGDVKTATPTPPSAVPIALTPGQWTWAANPGLNGTIDLTILGVPSAYPPLQRIEYQVDGGAWQDAGFAGTGSRQITGLNNGQSYAGNVRAVNSMGSGPASTPKNATPAVPSSQAPDAFTIGMWALADAVAPAGNAVRVTIASMPAQGGSPITVVQYKAGAGSWTPLGLNGVGSIDLAVFTSGTPVSIMLHAVNSAGAGPDGDSKAATPTGMPAAFGTSDWSVAQTPGNVPGTSARLTVAVTPATNGKPITAIQYQRDGGAWTTTGLTAPGFVDLPGLTPGVPYTFALRAQNANGDGAVGATHQITLVNYSPPSAFAPGDWAVADAAVPAGTSLRFTINALPGQGGSAINLVEFQSDGGSWAPLGLNAPGTIDISGFTVAQAHTLALRASNAIGGAGPASATKAATPTGVPLAWPTNEWTLEQTPGNTDGTSARITVATLPGAQGKPVTSTQYQINGGGWINLGLLAPGFVDVAGLPPGVLLGFQLRAQNANGPAAAGGTKNITLIDASTPPALIEADWSLVNAEANNTAIIHLFNSAPDVIMIEVHYIEDGGPPSGWIDSRLTGPGSETYPNLNNFSVYEVELRQVNAFGPGPASDTKTVVPTPPLAAPIPLRDGDWAFNPGPTSGELIFSLEVIPETYPPITDVQYRLEGGAWTTTGLIAPGEFSLTGLTNGRQYSGNLRLVNASGAGGDATEKYATPQVPIGSPPDAFDPDDWAVIDTGAGQQANVAVLNLPPSHGANITLIEYRIDGGSWVNLGIAGEGNINVAVSPNGTARTIAMRATNSGGPGPASATKPVTPTGRPANFADNQWNLSQTPGNTLGTSARVTMTGLPVDNGKPLTEIWYSINGAARVLAPILTTGFFDVPLLQAAIPYDFLLYAENDNGLGPAGNPKSITLVDFSPPPPFGVADWTFRNAALDGSFYIDIVNVAPGVTMIEGEYSENGGAYSGWIAFVSALPGERLVSGYLNFIPYDLRLRQSNIHGPSVESDIKRATATPEPVVPGLIPAGDWTWVPGDGEITLTVASVPDAYPAVDGFEYNLDGQGWVDSGLPGPGSIVLTGLNNDQSYTGRVRAFNAIGVGPGSDTKTATPLATVYPPPDPFGVGDWDVEDQATGGKLLFTIHNMPNDNGANIIYVEFQTNSGFWEILPLLAPGSFEVEGFPDGVSQACRLRAHNSGGTGLASDTKNVAPTGAPAAPAPGDWDVVQFAPDTSGTTVTLTITNLPATGGKPITDMEWSVGGAWTSLGLTAPGSRQILGFSPNVGYAFKIRAQNDNGAGPESATKNLTLINSSPPDAFTAGQWSVTDLLTGTTARLTVNAMPPDNGNPITRIEVRRDTGAWVASGLTGPGSVDLTGFLALTPVNLTIRAVSGTVPGPASDTKVFTPASSPAAFTAGQWIIEQKAGNTDGTVATLTISQMPNNGGNPINAIQYELDGGAWVATGLTAPGSVDIPGLIPDHPYNVAVRAANAVGPGAPSDVKSLTLEAASGSPKTVSFLVEAAVGGTALVKTFSGVNFGPADPDRCIIVNIRISATTDPVNPLPVSVTIGGVPAVMIVGQDGPAANRYSTSMWAAKVPTGATGTIVVSADPSNVTNSAFITVFRTTGYDPTNPVDTGVGYQPVYGMQPSTVLLDIPANGLGFCTTLTYSEVTGLTLYYTVNGSYYPSRWDAFPTAQADHNVTATVTSNQTEKVLLAAAFPSS